ncbi:MAG: hypothetical protein COC12_05420 [Rhodobacteraceae bacterium]|nr:MAG: hypothetical protein COC12_05420 [Paracoccaceae bacterium]
MTFLRPFRIVLLLAIFLGLAACGGNRNKTSASAGSDVPIASPKSNPRESSPDNYAQSSIWDVFGGKKADQIVNVNRYLWVATLDVLSFLPVQSVDPFTGVIVTGYGTPPGGGRSYRATVHIRDPALDARSLKVSLQTKSGPVSLSTARAVEDAILARARQIRIGDSKL